MAPRNSKGGKKAASKRKARTPSPKTTSDENNNPPSPDGCPPPSPKTPKVTVEILTPPVKSTLDRNEYRCIRLPNGIIALLIHTPKEGQTGQPAMRRGQSSPFSGRTEETAPFLIPDRNYLIQPANMSELDPQASFPTMDDPCGPGGCGPETGTGIPGIGQEDGDIGDAAKSPRTHDDPSMASIAVVINVGASEGPKNRVGLAHFCEHGVHYGSQGFPTEDEYWTFLINTTTNYNAYTSTLTTTYHFDIRQDYLSQGAKMLVDALAFPTFTNSLLGREVHSIDNEFYLKYHHDMRSFFNILVSLTKKDHPLSHFGCGNLKTLLHGDGGDEEVNKLRADLMKFHTKNYVGSGTTLAVQSSNSLDDMQEMVMEEFIKLPKGDKKTRKEFVVPPSERSPFDTPDFKRMYAISGKSTPEPYFIIQWALPPAPWMDTTHKPFNFLGQLIAAEWEHGLGRRLHEEGHIIGSVYAGCPESSELHRNSYVAIFSIQLILNTHEMGEKGEGGCGDTSSMNSKILPKVYQVLRHVFSHLGRIRRSSPERMGIIWNELAQINNNFMENSLPPKGSELAIMAAHGLQLRPGEELFTWDRCLPNGYNDDIVRRVLDQLSPESANTMFTIPPNLLPKHKAEFTRTPWIEKVEPYYKTTYWGRTLDKRTLDEMNRLWAGEPGKNLDKMTRNPFDTLEPPIQDFMNIGKHHKQILKNEKLIVYHQGNAVMDPNSRVAEVVINVVSSAVTIHHQTNVCGLKLWKSCLEQVLEPVTTSIAQSGIKHYLWTSNKGTILNLAFVGFPSKLPLAVEAIMRVLFPEDQERNGIYDEKMVKTGKAILMNQMNEKLGEGRFLTDHLFEELMTLGLPSFRSNTKFVENFTHKDLVGFNQLISRTSIVVMHVGGNISEKTIAQIAQNICNLNYLSKNGEFKIPRTNVLPLLPFGNKTIRVKTSSRKEHNSIITNYYEFVPQNGIIVEDMVEFLSHYLRSPFFGNIRTQKQFTYSCSLYAVFPIDKSPMIKVYVAYPGVKHSICEIDNAIDTFFWDVDKNYLQKLDDTGFKRLRQMWGHSGNLTLEKVKTFYKETFLTEIQPPEDVGKNSLPWKYTTTGKVRKFSLQVLAAEERCQRRDCNGVEWTKNENCVISFAKDKDCRCPRYIHDIRDFRG